MPMLPDQSVINQPTQIAIIQQRDLIHFMGSTEAIKEMQERNTRFQGGRLGNQRKISGFLHGIRTEQRKAGRARRHHVAVVTENRERMRRQSAGGHMNHGWRQLSRDFVHIGNHQQQPLGRGERRSQRSSLKRTMQSAGRASFTLHFYDRRYCAPDVLASFFLPLVRPLPHRRSRSDGIDRNHFVEPVRYRGRSFVSVQNGCVSDQSLCSCPHHCSFLTGPAETYSGSGHQGK